jgi:serine/threonine protein phosphatase PrpC
MITKDPHAFDIRLANYKHIYAISTFNSKDKIHNIATLNFQDECFVIAEGNGDNKLSEFAAKFAAETAIWGYKEIRTKKFYWNDKKKFMERIFRSVNNSLWQKHRETGYESGLHSTLSVLMIGTYSMWIGVVGDNAIYRIHQDEIILESNQEKNLNHTEILGKDRYGTTNKFFSQNFEYDDIVIMLNSGFEKMIDIGELFSKVKTIGDSTEKLQSLIDSIVSRHSLKDNSNKSICIIKKIRL